MVLPGTNYCEILFRQKLLFYFTMQYLHEDQYYIDLYDLLTVKECLHSEENIAKGKLPKYKDKEILKK